MKLSQESVPFKESIKAKRSLNQRAWLRRANQTNGPLEGRPIGPSPMPQQITTITSIPD